MTRENKLALVIGFGLLLLAGILVSDHLSSGQRATEEPLLASGERVVPPTTLLQPRTGATNNARPTRQVVERTPAVSEPRPLQQITIGGGGGTVSTVAGSGSTRPAPAVQPDVHFVKKGETLSAISSRYYGSPDFAAQIARNNNIPNPRQIRVGTRLVLTKSPNERLASSRTARPVARAAGPRKVTVKEGETLSEIAKRELGNETKWHELWQMNRGAVPNPDRLKPGTTLNLPAT